MAIRLNPEERALLVDTFLFRNAGPAPLEAALEDPRCIRAEAVRGEIIYNPEQFRRCLAVLLAGAVQVSKEDLILSVLRPGELFGAAALFNSREDYATTLTAKRPCSLVLLPQELVEELMARFPTVGRNYIAYLSDRIRFLNGKIDSLIAGSAERKLAQYLLAGVCDGRVGLECPASGLAQRLHVGRASLYRAFDALTEAGLIRRKGREVRVLNAEGLKQV